MSFRLNSFQQISLFDKLAFLSDRKLKILQNSWAQAFFNHVFTKIDEQMFAPLYSEKTNSRPNAPVNVIVGALILKDFTGQTDDEMLESVEFDYRYQYAFHTTSFSEQPLSDRTFNRFRERCAAYELTTGEDPIHKCFVSISEEMRKFMDISPNMKCMDREMGRLELLYTCVSNLVKELRHDGRTVTECPAGNTPKANSYIHQIHSIRVSFFKEQCENCPHQVERLVHLKKRTTYLILSLNARTRAQENKEQQDDEALKKAGIIRNGVETLPSILRRKYHVDRMPVRRKLKTKQFFSFKVMALNFSKLLRFTQGLEKCRTLAPVNG